MASQARLGGVVTKNPSNTNVDRRSHFCYEIRTMDQCDELSLSDEQRDECLTRLNEDGFSVLPLRLPVDLLDRIVHYIDTYIDRVRNYEPDLYRPSG